MKLRATIMILFALAVLVLNGCRTGDEPENVSERPWNSPKGWEYGIPGMSNEGR